MKIKKLITLSLISFSGFAFCSNSLNNSLDSKDNVLFLQKEVEKKNKVDLVNIGIWEPLNNIETNLSGMSVDGVKKYLITYVESNFFVKNGYFWKYNQEFMLSINSYLFTNKNSDRIIRELIDKENGNSYFIQIQDIETDVHFSGTSLFLITNSFLKEINEHKFNINVILISCFSVLGAGIIGAGIFIFFKIRKDYYYKSDADLKAKLKIDQDSDEEFFNRAFEDSQWDWWNIIPSNQKFKQYRLEHNIVIKEEIYESIPQHYVHKKTTVIKTLQEIKTRSKLPKKIEIKDVKWNIINKNILSTIKFEEVFIKIFDEIWYQQD